jgi:glycosyltransferase involved in cell wall biosynthesis
LPFNVGLCVGRNEGIKRVKTKYVLIGDDDFYYTNDDVSKLLRLMYVSDIAGGRVIENGTVKNYQGTFSEEDGGLVWNELDISSFYEHKGVRYTPCHLVFNYFVAKKSLFTKIKWDNKIKVSYEHSDFFIQCWKKDKKVVFCHDAFVTHKPNFVLLDSEKEQEYNLSRHNKADKDYFVKKWDYIYYKDMKGNLI